MSKNLILSVVGNNSYHKEWIAGKKNFDIILIYYGNDEEIYQDYKNDAMICINQKGQKYPIIKNFIDNNKDLILKYSYIWLPDDDVSISTDQINRFFKITKEYKFSLCQPALNNKPEVPVVYEVTKHDENFLFRYTNFVEVMAPLFSSKTLMFLYDDFGNSESGWGLDFTWVHRLGTPQDKIAIIDATPMEHTKANGSDYSRFNKTPLFELESLLKKYKLEYSIIGETRSFSHIPKNI